MLEVFLTSDIQKNYFASICIAYIAYWLNSNCHLDISNGLRDTF